ncbi:MAG: universal stress protein [Elusimicrobiota bacterium]
MLPRRILVAADLCPPSLSALGAAKELALRWNASVEIIYVKQPPMISAGNDHDGVPLSVLPVVAPGERKVEERLRRAAAGLPPERLSFQTVHGWLPAALSDLARPPRADMMVMGTHGYAGLDRLLTGSVAESVLRRARIPVLAVPKHTSLSRVARIFAPWNAASYATRALLWAKELARSFRATLDVFHVEEPGMSGRRDWFSLDRRLRSILGEGSDWTLQTQKGDARKRIVAQANSGRYELVVLSAHRRSLSFDIVLGSTIERLLRHSRVPVLGVPTGRSRPRLVDTLALAVGSTR